MGSPRFDILSTDEIPDEELLSAIETAFGKPRGIDWFRWKHREGPWGRSHGVVAVDDSGVIGVRMLVPWKVSWRGEDRVFKRATEAATIPRARGMGVFTALNRKLMEQALTEEHQPVFFSTPNAQSRDGYAKLGWSWLGWISHRWCPPIPLPGSRRRGHFGATAGSSAVTTLWTEDALRWRIDRRSGNQYRQTCSGSRATTTYRVISYRLARVILPVHTAGSPQTLRRLLLSVALRERAVAIIDTQGEGAQRLVPLSGMSQGGSLVAAWHPHDPDLGRLANWRLSMGDLEGLL